ncbi:MAG: carboxypeptidase-like regulatory domain-containing protein [Flavobacteriaceae bacterium]|nr:carboxypeptidase-like regulatory domain-containing protein [Flavobacteriaceae bacterium]MDG2314134.1 carboxypeptidase-like regulatory domain-containing protein [Flavobacteriaceae bacterium]
MQLKTVISTVLFFIGLTTWGQNVRYQGVVKDSIGNPITAANVVAIKKETKGLESFAITDEEGTFKLGLKKSNPYQIKISYLGFKTKAFSLTPQNDVSHQITLFEMAENLDEVEVSYQMPVTIKGDTIVYDTDSFNTGSEKKLEDVLKNLPGVEVNDEGQIEVEGKRVQKVMLEGKDFFDGDSKLATQNIPSNVVSKIEVLRNFSEVSQLSNVVDNDDNLAINIRLKEGKKNFWFGEVSVGAGPDNRFLMNPKLFYYHPTKSFNFIGNKNNLGKSPLTRRDYYNFTGGFRNLNQKSGASIAIKSDDLRFSSLQSNRAKSLDTQFGAFNFGYDLSKNFDISGFIIVSKTATEIENIQIRNYNANDRTETVSSQVFQNNDLQLYKLSGNYTPNDFLQVEYDILIKNADQNEDSVKSSVSQQIEEIVTHKRQAPSSINQSLSAYFSSNEKHIFSFESQHLFQNEDPFYNAIRMRRPFESVLPLDASQTNYNINQSRDVSTNKWEAKMDYFYVFNPRVNLNLTLGTTQGSQEFDSSIFQILDDNSISEMEASFFNNQVEHDFSDIYLGAHIRFISGIFTLEPGFAYHKFNSNDKQLGTSNSNNFYKMLPDIRVKLQFKKSETLRFTYRMINRFSDINSYAQGYVFKNYSSLYAGNRELEASLFHNYNLNYYNFNTFSFTNITGRLSYSKREEIVKNSSYYEGINRVTSPINSSFADHVYTAFGRFQKRFSNFKTEASLRVSYSEKNNVENDQYILSKGLNQNYKVSIASNFRSAPNLELGYNFIQNQYQKNNQVNTFYTDSPFARFDADFGKGFVLASDFSYYHYRNQSAKLNEYSFLDIVLYYQKPKSKWEISIEATNVLNNHTLNRDGFTNFYDFTTSYVVQPRYLLFSIKYNL